MELIITDITTGNDITFHNVKHWEIKSGGLIFIVFEDGEQQILSPHAFSQIFIQDNKIKEVTND